MNRVATLIAQSARIHELKAAADLVKPSPRVELSRNPKQGLGAPACSRCGRAAAQRELVASIGSFDDR